MEVTLNNLQKQVDSAIDARIIRLSMSAYKEANFLPNGTRRRRYVPYTHPVEVSELLALKQKLYSGEDPEAIMATITGGGIEEAYFKANEA